MENIRIMFLRNNSNHPVGCIAMKIGSGSLEYQVSTLNPVDRFNRRVARQLAIGRLVEKPIRLAFAKSNVHEVVRFVMQHISVNESLPARSQRAARMWLNSSDLGSCLDEI